MTRSLLGFTNGAYDLLHLGHLRTLEFARAHCDRLVVGVNSDASVRFHKGSGRPINPVADRVAILKALRCVDEVIVFGEATPWRLIQDIEPDVLVKGAEYEGRVVVGEAAVRARGGIVLFAPMIAGKSTTALIEVIHD